MFLPSAVQALQCCKISLCTACTDAAAIHDLVLSWLWPLWTPPAISLHLHFQHIIGPGTSLPCRAVPTLQPITWACQPPLTCSCHGLPFSTAGTHASW